MLSVVLCANKSEGSLNALRWIEQNRLGLGQSISLIILHVRENETDGIALLRKYESLAKNFTDSVKIRLLDHSKGVGQAIKEYVNGLLPKLLVLGRSQDENSDVAEFCMQRCDCPVVIVKRNYKRQRTRPLKVAFAMDVNVHCDRAFNWFLRQADLPATAQLFVVHIVTKNDEKPDARKFLSNLKPRCLESKKPYYMASALVSYGKHGVAESLLKFCGDRDIEMLIIPSKGDTRFKMRLKNSIMKECFRNCSSDILVWMDDQTRNLSSSPYIFQYRSTSPSPNSNPVWIGDQKKNSELGDRKQTNPNGTETPTPPPPTYPRNRPTKKLDLPNSPNNSKPTPPFNNNNASHHKNSLKYYVYDQIAKGKKQISKISNRDDSPRRSSEAGGWDDVFVEPLSP